MARRLTAHRPLRYASVPLSLCLVSTLRSARSSWLEARVGHCRLRPAVASHAASAHAPTHVCAHSTLGLTIIANDRSLRFLSFMHSPPRCSHHPRVSQHAQRLSFSSSGFPPFSWPAVLSFFSSRVASAALSFCLLSRCAARHAYPQAKTRSLARTPTADGGRTTRRAVRRHG
jgi:hypothetical protein